MHLKLKEKIICNNCGPHILQIVQDQASLLVPCKNAHGKTVEGRTTGHFFLSFRFVALNYNCSQNVFGISLLFGHLRMRAMMF